MYLNLNEVLLYTHLVTTCVNSQNIFNKNNRNLNNLILTINIINYIKNNE